MAFDKNQLEKFPTQSGVYLMKDALKDVIYVGKAKNLKNRIKQYFAAGGDGREMVPFLTEQIVTIDIIVVPSEKEALLLENTLIKKHQPKFNAILKDDKTFISLMINVKHQWPMIKLVRYKGKPKNDGLYFGPYTSAYAARQTFDLLTQLFPLRQCSDEELKRRTRPCLLYSIKRCVAPCVNRCTKQEYDTLVDGAIRFLKGQDKEIIKNLYKEMEKASEKLEFEKAAALLNTIRQIEHVTEKDQHVVRLAGKDCDALALYRSGDEVILVQLIFREGKLIGSEHFSFSFVAQEDEELFESFLVQHYKDEKNPPKEILLPVTIPGHKAVEDILPSIHILTPQKGEKKALVEMAKQNAVAIFKQEKDQREIKEKMLLDLADTCKLLRYPSRIECFDTSNISGTNPVASMIAFTDGIKDRKRTRLFHIKGVEKSDDYGAMHQVLSRRLLRAKDEDDLPDLVIVDGGKGHLNIALEVFKELDIANVDAIGIAKEESSHTKGMTQEKVFIPNHKDPILLNPRSQVLFLLQQIRDEAHNKAIEFHRKSRQKRVIASSLQEVEGIGPIKRTRLLKHFGSIKRIQDASDEQLQEVKGINQKDIKTLRAFFKKSNS